MFVQLISIHTRPVSHIITSVHWRLIICKYPFAFVRRQMSTQSYKTGTYTHIHEASCIGVGDDEDDMEAAKLNKTVPQRGFV